MEKIEDLPESVQIKVEWESQQSNDRNKIMHISTQIESSIAELLKLAIGDYDHKSISFGYSSSALSLAARINLLIDFNIFTKDEKRYFETFTQIRNKFAHDHNVQNLHSLLTENKDRKMLNTLEKSFKDIRVDELLVIQGFPDDYIMIGPETKQKKFIGNSVVPLAYKVILLALEEEIFSGHDDFHNHIKLAG